MSGREKRSRDERVDARYGEIGRCASAHIRLRRASQPLSATLAARGSLSTGNGVFGSFRDCERNGVFGSFQGVKTQCAPRFAPCSRARSAYLMRTEQGHAMRAREGRDLDDLRGSDAIFARGAEKASEALARARANSPPWGSPGRGAFSYFRLAPFAAARPHEPAGRPRRLKPCAPELTPESRARGYARIWHIKGLIPDSGLRILEELGATSPKRRPFVCSCLPSFALVCSGLL